MSTLAGQRSASAGSVFFQSVSHIQPPNLTPRSREACRRHGVEPVELLPLPFDSFREPNKSDEVARIKYDKYEAMRKRTLRIVNEERTKLVSLEELGVVTESSIFAFAPRPEARKSPNKSTAELQRAQEFAKLTSTAVERDRAQIDAMKARQQEEIEQMILYEIKQQRILDEREERAAAEDARIQQLRREVEKRRREFAERQQALAVERAKREREEQKRLKANQRKQLEADRKRAELGEARLREYHEQVRQKEAAIRAKAQVRQERHAAKLHEREIQTAKKAEEDAERERIRRERLELQKRRTADENARKRQLQDERVRAAAEAHEARQRKQQEDFARREAESEERRMRWERDRLAHLNKLAGYAHAKRDKATVVLRQLERANDKYMEETERRQEGAEANRRAFHQQVREKLDQRAAEHDLDLFERHLTVHRRLHREAYVRECLGEKLRREDERIESMLNYKEQSLKQRRELADKAVKDKVLLAERIERMRQSKVFQLEPDQRASIKNPELRLLFDMCDRHGTGRISLMDVKSAVKKLSDQGRITQDGRIILEEEARQDILNSTQGQPEEKRAEAVAAVMFEPEAMGASGRGD
mmetsp:Transcript_27883/g.81969  ORF Transcript_27883/g.81969 Transcript_27883/m.81969 type:complete len:593 (-) Transcript_27883:68-1846(-)|eukprot:CAMPEP_0206039156 /NCGR_PEP_ID=MMETSP1466-20131121/4558_1 /ASSEMBLY_ACC=CAM_ASM_001126 /TAXON_ID=44452 /ORGANISM="Pavlova gyrans, Strain CCMP608" /LENGTH=592 /DNA_ID=CAMNT_0053413777 /DNA_START=52 /DNA_END=1830 /DNA_ORIENTATION=+